jgi:hypothetical protein
LSLEFRFGNDFKIQNENKKIHIKYTKLKKKWKINYLIFRRFFKPKLLENPIKLDDLTFLQYMAVYKIVYFTKEDTSDFVDSVSKFIVPRNRTRLSRLFNLNENLVTVKQFLENVKHYQLKDNLRKLIEDESEPTETIEIDCEGESSEPVIQIKQEKDLTIASVPVQFPDFVIDLTEDDEDEDPSFDWLTKSLDQFHLINELNVEPTQEEARVFGSPNEPVPSTSSINSSNVLFSEKTPRKVTLENKYEDFLLNESLTNSEAMSSCPIQNSPSSSESRGDLNSITNTSIIANNNTDGSTDVHALGDKSLQSTSETVKNRIILCYIFFSFFFYS